MFQEGVEVLLRGGWVMLPLLLCAFVSIAVMIERSIVLRRAAQDKDDEIPPFRYLFLKIGFIAENENNHR